MDGEDFFYFSGDGLKLHARIHGTEPGKAWPVVCLPGLTRNARDFDGLARYLATQAEPRRQVVAFDYRGRGLSAADPDWRNYSIVTEAEDVISGLSALGIEKAAFVGTSRGGLILHIIAGKRPQCLKAVILNDVGPELGREGLAQIKSYLDKPAQPASFSEALLLQKRTHGPAFPALTDAEWESFVRALYRERDGKPVLDFDPALLNTVRQIDLEKPLPDLWEQFDAFAGLPLLVLRGEHSRLLTAETLEAMQQRQPAMQAVTVMGQGHAPLLDTAGLPERIAAFFNEAERAAGG